MVKLAGGTEQPVLRVKLIGVNICEVTCLNEILQRRKKSKRYDISWLHIESQQSNQGKIPTEKGRSIFFFKKTNLRDWKYSCQDAIETERKKNIVVYTV